MLDWSSPIKGFIVYLKEKKHKNTNAFCLKVLGKLHIWKQTAWKSDTFLKLLRFYVFKMAANGGHYFEINIKQKNCQTQFIC